MSGTAAPPVSTRPGWVDWLFRRQLDYYPETRARVTYLAITVLATITLYYELYVGGSVSTLILANLHMSFTFFVLTLAFGALIGAFGSLFAGITDRLGRANLVVFGLFFTAVFVAFIMPDRDQQVDVHHRGLGGRLRGGHLPGRHPRPDQGLLPAGGPGHGHGLLDQRPGDRQPDRLGGGHRHHPRRRQRRRGSGPTSTASAASPAWSCS